MTQKRMARKYIEKRNAKTHIHTHTDTYTSTRNLGAGGMVFSEIVVFTKLVKLTQFEESTA